MRNNFQQHVNNNKEIQVSLVKFTKMQKVNGNVKDLKDIIPITKSMLRVNRKIETHPERITPQRLHIH